MFEVASFSLLSLLVFRPLVRGGEGAEMPSDSEFLSILWWKLRKSSIWPPLARGSTSVVRSSSGVLTLFKAAEGAAFGVVSSPSVTLASFLLLREVVTGEATFAAGSTAAGPEGAEGPGKVSFCSGMSVSVAASISGSSTSCNASKLFLDSTRGGITGGGASL